MSAPRPRVTFELPTLPHTWADGALDIDCRRRIRQQVASINADLAEMGRQHRIGRLWRLERNHRFGIMAIYAMEPVTQETVH